MLSLLTLVAMAPSGHIIGRMSLPLRLMIYAFRYVYSQALRVLVRTKHMHQYSFKSAKYMGLNYSVRQAYPKTDEWLSRQGQYSSSCVYVGCVVLSLLALVAIVP